MNDVPHHQGQHVDVCPDAHVFLEGAGRFALTFRLLFLQVGQVVTDTVDEAGQVARGKRDGLVEGRLGIGQAHAVLGDQDQAGQVVVGGKAEAVRRLATGGRTKPVAIGVVGAGRAGLHLPSVPTVKFRSAAACGVQQGRLPIGIAGVVLDAGLVHVGPEFQVGFVGGRRIPVLEIPIVRQWIRHAARHRVLDLPIGRRRVQATVGILEDQEAPLPVNREVRLYGECRVGLAVGQFDVELDRQRPTRFAQERQAIVAVGRVDVQGYRRVGNDCPGNRNGHGHTQSVHECVHRRPSLGRLSAA